MFGPHICLRCRQQFIRKAQSIRRIGFVSLSQSTKQDDGLPLEDANPRRSPNQHGPRSVPRPQGNQGRTIPVRRPTTGLPYSSSGVDSVLEDLFSSTQQELPAVTRTRYSGKPIHQAKRPHEVQPPRSQIRETNPIETLRQQFYRDQSPLRDVWRNCETLLATKAQNKAGVGQTSSGAYQLYRDLLIAISRRFIHSDGTENLPSPHEVIIEYRKRGVLSPWWNDVLWINLSEIIRLLHGPDGSKSAREIRALDDQIIRLMEEVIRVWSASLGQQGKPSTPPENNLKHISSQFKSAGACFKSLFPQYRDSCTHGKILAACKLTHQCLKEIIDCRKLALHITPSGQAFISLLNLLVEGRTFPTGPGKINLAQEGIPKRLIDHWVQYSSGWGEKPVIYEKAPLPSEANFESTDSPRERLETPIAGDHTAASLEQRGQQLATSIELIKSSLKGKEDSSVEVGSEATSSKASLYRAATTIIKDLETAVERYDVARVASIWQSYERNLAGSDLEPKSREEIYIHFLSAFFSLSRQEQAVHVWNHMLQAGTSPNQRHWNAMLSGSSKARDVTSLEEIWNNMITAGIEPDMISWTTYIHGLISCKKFERGLQTLNDLGARWTQAKRTLRANEVPHDGPTTDPRLTLSEYDANKPSLIPVQSAASALIRIGRSELCSPLIEWAKAHSIPLTTVFFNILLRPAVRAGDTENINHLLSLMKANDCSADERTYTILLNAHMSNTNSTFSTLPPQEQQDSIFRILNDMSAKGVPIDQRIYGTILYGLLNPKNGNRNDKAARAVFDHMHHMSIKPSHYIYSILASHYFSLSPPNLQAVEHLWKRIKSEHPILDRDFYEKMVEGYAAARLTERMLYFLRRIPHEGKSPTWKCLLVVLNTLAEIGEWSLVKELVEDVKDRKNGLRRYADEGWKGGRMEEEFWLTVKSLADLIHEAP
ncbi:MAG: hypothetical protein Q9182_006183 [Xanthomendoza sp. 2 TL-2023]